MDAESHRFSSRDLSLTVAERPARLERRQRPPVQRSGYRSVAACFSWFTGLIAVLLSFSSPAVSDAANQRTRNFLVHANDPGLARSVAQAAEKYRHDLAMHWLGKPLPPWPAPCPIRVISGPNLAAQGVTTYNPRPVRDFQMEVVGTPERILDSVLPHEVTHTILATHFGRPLPRWADEGICTTVEHSAERSKHEAKLREFLSTRRGIAMNRLFLMTEYPADVLPMYAQGYSVCRFLIAQKGPRTFIQFLQDYMRQPSWTANVQKHYGYDSLRELQEYWLAWVDAGSRDVSQFSKSRPAESAEEPGRLAGQPEPATPDSSLLALNAPRGGHRSGPATIEPAEGTALAEASSEAAKSSGGGWYQRRRAGVIEHGPAGNHPTPPSDSTDDISSSDGNPASRPQPNAPILPPSVRDSGRYSVAQPQPERRF